MNYYEILDLPPSATLQQIRRAHRELVQIYHPDRMYGLSTQVRRRAEDKLKLINKAYTVLTNPEERAKYDRLFAQQKISSPKGEVQNTAITLDVDRKAIEAPNENAEGSFSGIFKSFRSFLERFVG